MTEELLKRYLSNQCSPEEVEKVLFWLGDISESHIKKRILKDIWESSDETQNKTETDFNRLLDKIHHKINIQSTNRKLTIRSGYKPLIKQLSKIAAVLFIPLLAISIYGYFLWNKGTTGMPVYTEIHAPNGSRANFNLPDGSEVWLNNGSSLKFPEKFKGKYRNVELKGEAFFDIKHNEKSPLVVEAEQIHVMVHGTRFNILNYKDTDLEVTLESGSISVNSKIKEKKYKEIIRLHPNEQVVYKKEANKLSHQKVNVRKYLAWKDGIIMFEKDPLHRVAQHLERSFNVEINIADKEIENFTFTATFVDESLSQILGFLKLAMPIDYTIEHGKKQPNGSFSKTKILFKKR